MPETLISNRQTIGGSDTQVVFEFDPDAVRIEVCITKPHTAPPIPSKSLAVTLLDLAGREFRCTREPTRDDLIETHSGGCTAHAHFEFERGPGQNVLHAKVSLREQSKIFLLEDAVPLR